MSKCIYNYLTLVCILSVFSMKNKSSSDRNENSKFILYDKYNHMRVVYN